VPRKSIMGVGLSNADAANFEEVHARGRVTHLTRMVLGLMVERLQREFSVYLL